MTIKTSGTRGAGVGDWLGESELRLRWLVVVVVGEGFFFIFVMFQFFILFLCEVKKNCGRKPL